jgi:hypothetical protein
MEMDGRDESGKENQKNTKKRNRARNAGVRPQIETQFHPYSG